MKAAFIRRVPPPSLKTFCCTAAARATLQRSSGYTNPAGSKAYTQEEQRLPGMDGWIMMEDRGAD